MKAATYRIGVIISLVGTIFWCGASLTMSKKTGSPALLSHLSGGDQCKCKQCTDDTRESWTCRHTTMDPNTACDTDLCNRHKLYFSKCPPQAGGTDCEVQYSETALVLEQWRHNVTAGSTACQYVSQSVQFDWWGQQPCEVINKGADTDSGTWEFRCKIERTECNGNLLLTLEPRNGRYVCKT